ncbi:MAG: undecaprenyldiphospho-muramoylpentapeptide beta-N-acetylglucosaminyltransferase [Abditibacteriota bacterium]|nr:undecaprenyldiphospho-muramoylpentapeptide beta-N-acetylglucosaminyltransferase [Abditibacteriota bacterium]
MNIVITGGGTGGHVYPAIAVASFIKNNYPESKLLYIGTENGPERPAAAAAGIDFAPVPAVPMNRIVSLKGLGALRELVSGIRKSVKLLEDFRADVVFGTGGFVCSPVYVAAKRKKIPVVVHEQNSVPGKANLQVSGYASAICITFPEAAPGFPSGRPVLTGLPVRKEFFSLPDKEQAMEKMGIKKGAFTVLVCGGSQGALSINKAVTGMVKKQLVKDAYFIHQTGKNKLESVLEEMKDYKEDNYRAYGFLDMPLAFACADLVVSRAGASTTTELQAAGLPSILIPYPYAAADHQYHNAEAYRNAGGCELIKDSELTPEVLADKIRKLRNGNVLKRMSENAARAAVPDAAKKITEIIMEAVR